MGYVEGMLQRHSLLLMSTILTAVIALGVLPASAQPYRGENAEDLYQRAAVMYEIDVARTASQLITVRMTLPDIDAESTVLHLPVWRPGRYEILDPAGTVRTVSATGDGQPIDFTKTDKSTWVFETSGVQDLHVEYTIYANSINNRTRHADHSHAFISPSSVLMYNPDRRDEPARVSIVGAPEGWRTATGLSPAPNAARGEAGPMLFVARDYDTLVDAPLEIGLHDKVTFDLRGVPHEIVIWGRHEADMERLKEDFAAITESQARIFEEDGPLPYERYVFMIHCGPGLGGGTEHVNSTIMLTTPSTFTDQDRYERFLGLVSHEMFHTWNVKRLRPEGITPYRWQEENYSELFWVAEGTTSYYDDLILVRTGLIDVQTYLDRLEGSIRSTRLNPGLLVQSLEDSSFDAWIKFNQRTPDTPNFTVNFYSQGALASLVIDQWVREATADERSLDNVMRVLYQNHPLEGGGFTTDDLAQAIAEAAEQSFQSARDLIASLVGKPTDLPLERWLEPLGLELTSEVDDEGSDLGLRLIARDGFAAVRTVMEGHPAFDAGFQADDLIVAVDGEQASPESIEDLLSRTPAGTPLKVSLFRRGQLMEIEVATEASPPEWTLRRTDEPTRSQRSRFQSWLGQPFDAE